jgi:hypothetical protein
MSMSIPAPGPPQTLLAICTAGAPSAARMNWSGCSSTICCVLVRRLLKRVAIAS